MMLPPSLRLPVQMAGLLHFLVVVFIIYGLPALIEPEPETVPTITVEVANIAEINNARQAERRPTPKPTEEKVAEEAPPPPKAEPKPETPPPPPPPPVKQPDPPPPPPKPEPVPTPPPPPPKPDPIPTPPPPKVEPPKPEPPKPEPPKPEPPKPVPVKKPEPEKDFFKEMQAAVDAAKPKTPPTPAPKPAQKAAQSPTQTQTANATPAPPASNAPNYDESKPLSSMQEDAVKKAVTPCWNFDAGALRAGKLRVDLRLTIAQDGSVQSAVPLDTGKYLSDSYFRSAADAARRAVMNPQCNKLPLPADRFADWHTAVFTFDPKEIDR